MIFWQERLHLVEMHCHPVAKWEGIDISILLLSGTVHCQIRYNSLCYLDPSWSYSWNCFSINWKLFCFIGPAWVYRASLKTFPEYLPKMASNMASSAGWSCLPYSIIIMHALWLWEFSPLEIASLSPPIKPSFVTSQLWGRLYTALMHPWGS